MSVKHLVTVEDLWQMPELRGRNIELIDGEAVEVTAAITRHGLLVTKVAWLLQTHVTQHDVGVVATGDVGYVLRRDPDLMRAPDVSFIAWDNPLSTDLPERGFSEGAPTIAVEVVSPDDRASEVRTKVQHFLEAGTAQVWVVWPDQRSVTVFNRDGTARELGPEATLDGGEILPGFTVRVRDLFEIGRRRS